MSANMISSSSLICSGTLWVDVSAKRHPHELDLGAVDEATEDPSTATEALPGTTLPAVPANARTH